MAPFSLGSRSQRERVDVGGQNFAKRSVEEKCLLLRVEDMANQGHLTRLPHSFEALVEVGGLSVWQS